MHNIEIYVIQTNSEWTKIRKNIYLKNKKKLIKHETLT